MSLLPLLLEASILLTLCLDLRQEFGLLSMAARLALTILASAGLLALASPIWRARRWRGAAAVLGTGAALLAMTGLIQEWRTGRVSADGGRERLEARALILQEDFTWLLGEMLRPIPTARVDDGDLHAAFAAVARAREETTLPAERYGLSVYSSAGDAVAWLGNATAAPPDLIATAASEPVFRIGGGEAAPRLYAAIIPASPGPVWVAELLLKSPALALTGGPDAPPRFDLLPRWEEVAPAHLQLRRRVIEEEVARLFEREGDRHWGRQQRRGYLTLSFPLRAPNGDHLAIVSLKDRHPSEEVAALRAAARRVGALLVVVVLLLSWLRLVRAAPRPSAHGRLLIGTVCIWSARWALLLIGKAAALPDLAAFDITLYASSAFGGLIRSPADLLLSAIACLAQARLLRGYLGTLPRPMGSMRRKVSRAVALSGAVLLAIVGGAWFHRFIDQLVLDARVDLSRVALDANWIPRTALQAGLFLGVTALVLVLIALIDLSRRFRGDGGGRFARSRPPTGAHERLPLVLRASLGVLGLTLLYVPILQHAYQRLHRDFFESELVPRVLHQEALRSELLDEALRSATEPDFATAASFAVDAADDDAGSVAYRLWTATPMARMGLASSLQLFDGDGRLLSRFAVDLPPMLDVDFTTAIAAADGDPVSLAPGEGLTIRKTVLFGARSVRIPRVAPLLAVMAIVDEYDNVPLLSAEANDLPLLRGQALRRSNPELLRSGLRVAVFGAAGERLHGSGEIPPPRPDFGEELGRGSVVWTSGEVGGGKVRLAYFGGAETVFALADPLPGLIGHLAVFLRLGLLNAALAALVLFIAHLARRSPQSWSLGTTFYGRLTAVFLLTALIPVVALAYFVTRFSQRELERGLVSSGLSSLQVARQVVEDYLIVSGEEQDEENVEDEEPPLTDNIVSWLSRVVRQDINVYREDDLLATSTRELYDSSILNRRLNGDVYRALYLDGAMHRLFEERIGEQDYLMIGAPLTIDRAGTAGVIAIPLTALRRAVAHKSAEVANAILISACLTVLLLAFVGWLVARRISEPIARLAQAARRVESGDLAVRVGGTGQAEIGVLIASFNRMAEALGRQRDDLERRKDYIEKILARATTGVISLDASGRLITINPAAQSLLAAEAGRLDPGENLPTRLAGVASLQPLYDALALGEAEDGELEVEMVLKGAEGDRRLHAVFLPLAGEEGTPAGRIVLLEDVTEIVRSGRLAAWAEIARRIAHEIKNPLTPIQLSAEHLRRLWRAKDRRLESDLPDCLDNIQRQVGTLRRIASEFSTYSRLPQMSLRPTSVSALVEEALRPYATAPPPGISVGATVPADIPAVLVDQAIIVQTLVNLIENALQAMPSGGTLHVGAEHSDGPEGRRCVRINVSDTGVGIDPALRSRLFEPYFSTKSAGTGLGLAIARKAIEEHGGSIDISSQVGEGTTVIIHLPVAPEGEVLPNR